MSTPAFCAAKKEYEGLTQRVKALRISGYVILALLLVPPILFFAVYFAAGGPKLGVLARHAGGNEVSSASRRRIPLRRQRARVATSVSMKVGLLLALAWSVAASALAQGKIHPDRPNRGAASNRTSSRSVYAGETAEQAPQFLAAVKQTGRFPVANLRRMQAVLGYP